MPERLKVGETRNLLTVLESRIYSKTFKTGTTRTLKDFLCRCTCGREKWIRSEHVNGGRTKSCGCLNYQPQCKDPQERAVRRVFMYTRASSKKRDLTFSLTKTDVRTLVFQNCFYCSSPPARVFQEVRPYGLPLAPCHGIDRIDSSLGYERANVVACCSTCNTMKWDLSVDAFLSHVALISSRTPTITAALAQRKDIS